MGQLQISYFRKKKKEKVYISCSKIHIQETKLSKKKKNCPIAEMHISLMTHVQVCEILISRAK